MSEQLWYYIDFADAQHGPITIPQLQALVAGGLVTPSSTVWTEALEDQWIPARNVIGLFPEGASVKPDPNTASVSVKSPAAIMNAAQVANQMANAAAPPTLAASSPTLRSPAVVTGQAQQPMSAPTAPMIPSTPTTQPIAGIAAPIPGTSARTPAPGQYQAAVPAPMAAQAAAAIPTKKGKSIFGILLLLIGLGVAGYGGWLLYDGGENKNLIYGLLGGGGGAALLGLILTIKGKKIPANAIANSPQPASGGVNPLGGIPSAAPVNSFNPATVAANVAAFTASTGAQAEHANPLLPANPAAIAAAGSAKPSPFAGVQAAAKPNPLLGAAAAAQPQNKLNTSVPAAAPPETGQS